MVASGNVPVATTTASFLAGGAELAARRILCGPGAALSPPARAPGSPPARPGPPMPRKALVCALELELCSVFTDVVDPGELVELLEFDTAVLELIQLVPPVGEILATYEENTRDFLFPDPKLTRGHHGSDREVLMKRSSSFTGIAPKLRFSTSSLITESLLSSGRIHVQDNLDRVHHSTPNGRLQTRSPKKNTPSPEKNRHCLATKNYEQPTIASKSRSPSPYTKRRMCELSEEARQRLAHLNLGPFEFRRETDKPPFVVRHIEHPSPTVDVHTWHPTRDSGREGWSRVSYDPSLLGSYRPKHTKIIRSHHGKDLDGSSDSCDEHPMSGTASRQFRSTSSLIRSAPSSLQKHSSSPVLNRSSLRERFNSGWSTPANGEEIHKRVKNILRTHSARQRLTFDESNSSKGDSSKTRDISCKDSLCGSELQSSSSAQQNTTVHLDNGEYWSNRAAVYKGKPHRAIFEDSLEKIYRNMYKKACGTISKRKIPS
ncbi:spermatogenesis-associated protein 6 isoform X4 [Chrysemys picta bellii]|uniref:spermatogenesis-associated protein 6 isoform X4 n=1 Tax=Chrysemys picta bellii TaxID=8478 RepID=UPI0032B1FD13